ncbi:DUF3006 domain-containing protein [Halobacterium wangiae]|uniref:DUF3006 domain-containing protein n=1 Tax=Halobacterium wangiae TaxID=2902623 RepID=UPI001E4C9E01|nr:DUF3006 domain-containing protein [Halobacterium wangiae]
MDRFEDNHAVVLLDGDVETVGEIILEKDQLPEDAQHVDAVLHIELKNEDLLNIEYGEEETRVRREHAQKRFDDLAKRPPSRD